MDVKFFELDKNNTCNYNRYVSILKEQSWSACKYLAKCLQDEKLFQKSFGEGIVIIMTIDDNYAGSCTLSLKDCIDDDSLFPWLGFLFVKEEYRGKHLSQKLINYTESKAFEKYNELYLATNHTGLYEKYGYTYLFERIDLWNEKDRIYVKKK